MGKTLRQANKHTGLCFLTLPFKWNISHTAFHSFSQLAAPIYYSGVHRLGWAGNHGQTQLLHYTQAQDNVVSEPDLHNFEGFP